MFGNKSERILESKDIQFITEQERNKKASSQFFLWFASNLTIGDLALGSLIFTFGISFFWFIIAVIIGNILGGTLLALMSIMGPKTGLPQMMIGRRSFGDSGGKVMAGLQWMNSMGWFIFNSIIAASAVAIIIFGVSRPSTLTLNGVSLGIGSYILPIVIVCIIVAVLAYLGDRIIHAFEKVMSVVLGVIFAVILYYVVTNMGGSLPFVVDKLSPVVFGLAIALTFSYIMSWGPYAADYSRYVKADASSKSVFGFTLLGAVLASAFVEIIGYLVAVNSSSEPEISQQMFNLLKPLNISLVGMFALFLGGLSANALNLYSNSLSLKSIGLRISRRTIVVLVVIVSIAVSYVGYLNYYSYFEDFLLILDYWITPWLGVMIADFFIVRKLTIRGEEKRKSGGIAILSYLVSILISIPFMNPGYLFVGPLSNYLGGVDVSFFISFSLAVIIYVLLSRFYSSRRDPDGK